MKNAKMFITIFLLSMILFIFLWVMTEKYSEINIQENNDNYSLILENNKLNVKTKIKEYPKKEILDFYKGYKVCAELEIPSINLKTNILEEYSMNSLEVSVAKFWGVGPNETGNFCVVGHNFRNKNMFSNLKKIKIGDKIQITDAKTGTVEYIVFKIDKVTPNDVSCLDSETIDEKEVTLITCTNDSKMRIIIKAKEFYG